MKLPRPKSETLDHSLDVKRASDVGPRLPDFRGKWEWAKRFLVDSCSPVFESGTTNNAPLRCSSPRLSLCQLIVRHSTKQTRSLTGRLDDSGIISFVFDKAVFSLVRGMLVRHVGRGKWRSGW